MNAESILLIVMNAVVGFAVTIAVFKVSRKVTRMDKKNDMRYEERKQTEILHCNLHMQGGDLTLVHVAKAVEDGANGRQKELFDAFKGSQTKYKNSITEAAADRAVFK